MNRGLGIGRPTAGRSLGFAYRADKIDVERTELTAPTRLVGCHMPAATNERAIEAGCLVPTRLRHPLAFQATGHGSIAGAPLYAIDCTVERVFRKNLHPIVAVPTTSDPAAGFDELRRTSGPRRTPRSQTSTPGPAPQVAAALPRPPPPAAPPRSRTFFVSVFVSIAA